MSTQTLRLAKIEDHEGYGVCAACDREGLRWIAVLSDGSRVGLECAKRGLGFRPAPSTYSWIADFEAIAEHAECGSTFVLWVAKTGASSRETRDGSLTAIGGVRAEWIERGWID